MTTCVCDETSSRNCPLHSEPEEPDLEYTVPPQWVRDKPPLPAPPEILALMRDLRRRVPTRFR